MRILVTGALGFIGQHLVNSLLQKDFEVGAVIRPFARPRIPCNWSRVHIIESEIESLCSTDIQSYNIIIHLASIGIRPRLAKLENLINVNVTSSATLLQKAHEAGVDRVVVTGTCHEYGESARLFSPIPVDAPLRPLNLYGASKSACFQIMYSIARQIPIELYYGRIFSVYGSGQHEDSFYPQLVDAALSGKNFSMTHGGQIRDFISVHDVCSVLINACTRSDFMPFQPIIENIASGKSMSLFNFAKSEWNRLNATGMICRGALPTPVDDVEIYSAEIPPYMPQLFVQTKPISQ